MGCFICSTIFKIVGFKMYNKPTKKGIIVGGLMGK
jgi:hypothetical protein